MTSVVSPEVRHWSVSRDRDHPERNEDAFRVTIDETEHGWRAFLVLADGAGSKLFSGEWAHALVDAATPGWLGDSLATEVDRVRRRFDPFEGQADGADFMREEKWREEGSAATFLAALVEPEGAHTRCRVTSVGDSLLLVSHPDRLTSFPFQVSSQFGNRTDAVHSQRKSFTRREWNFALGSRCLLAMASDAMGAWLLRRHEEQGARSVHAWLNCASERHLPSVDDDVTLAVLDVTSSRALRPVDFVADRLRRRVG